MTLLLTFTCTQCEFTYRVVASDGSETPIFCPACRAPMAFRKAERKVPA